ncbi:AlpA family transcriptional regulator [uncultured Zhongshania sp.]|uniref:helix-turn-helix transcriptional regulator n=1 Tax=uncultured Zhongshania sp. TaxID=1642288 RepID=UPI0030DB7F6B|tara:strand:- start:7642 stop:7893 length:252 start_codon:yes stop_codon:yes gene_type:complete
MSKEKLLNGCIDSLSHPRKILRMPQVIDRVGLSKSSIYELIAKGRFPVQIKLSARSCGWLESDIDVWIAQKLASHVSFGEVSQ